MIGSGVRRTGQIVTLDYQEVTLMTQPYATRAMTVNPFAEEFYTGTIELFPSSDVWVDQVRVKPNTVEIGDAFTESSLQTRTTLNDPQTGLAPVTWNSHEKWSPPTTSAPKADSKQIVSTTATPSATQTVAKSAPPKTVPKVEKPKIARPGVICALPSKTTTMGKVGRMGMGGMGGGAMGMGGGGTGGGRGMGSHGVAPIKPIKDEMKKTMGLVGHYGIKLPRTDADKQIIKNIQDAKNIQKRQYTKVDILKDLAGQVKRDSKGKTRIKNNPNILNKPTSNTGSVMGAGMGKNMSRKPNFNNIFKGRRMG